MSAAEEPESIAVPIVYVGADEVPVHYANSFIVQHQQNEFFLSIGTLTPPILIGSPDEVREQAKQISYVPVRVQARIAMTRDRLVELIGLLTENLATFDKNKGRG